jgi:hypothetical protein
LAAINNVVLYKTKLSNNTGSPYTRWFSSRSEQQAFFNSQIVKSFTNTTFQRIDESARLTINAESVANCNYMSFTNSEYNGRTWYAYIDSFRLESPKLTTVNFTIDPIQTFMFDIDIGESYVEREHVNSDEFGEHTVPEGIDYGELEVCPEGSKSVNLGDYVFGVFYVDKQTTPTGGGNNGILLDGVFTGCNIARLTNTTDLNNIITEFTSDSQKEIIAIIQAPEDTFPETGTGSLSGINLHMGNVLDAYGGKEIHNNKIFSYPFTQIWVTNMNGTLAKFKPELFSNESSVIFYALSAFGLNPRVVLYPYEYRATTGFRNPGLPEGLSRAWLPDGISLDVGIQCCYKSDVYAEWLARTNSQAPGEALKLFSGLALGAATGGSGTAAAAGSVLNFISNNIAEGITASLEAPQLKGQFGNISLNAKYGFNGFVAWYMGLKDEYIEKIDNYFDMYGYKVNAFKVPNVTGRKSWNFVKTAGANIIGNGIQNEWINKIRDMFDTGITLWHTNDIGNYSLDNTL